MIKRLTKHIVASPPFWSASAPIRRGGIAVLVYHRVGDRRARYRHIPLPVFEKQMRWLRDHCDVIHPSRLEAEAATASRRGDVRVMITFDDGYRSYHDLAYPILARLALPAVNFLPTAHIDDPVPFWWDVIDEAALTTTRPQAPLPDGAAAAALPTMASRLDVARAWKHRLKSYARPQESEMFEEVLAALGVTRTSLYLEREAMTWEEVRATAEWTTFGGHSHTHARLPLLSEVELAHEVGTCHARIRAETGTPPRLFAYPGGAVNAHVKAAVADSGFDTAFGAREAFVERSDDWLALGRLPAPATVADLAWMLTGWSR